MSLMRYTHNRPGFDLWGEWEQFLSPRRVTTTGEQVKVETVEGATRIAVAAPGVPKENFTVDFSDQVLKIGVYADAKDNTFVTESFQRSWRLPAGTTAEDVTATHQDGVLVVMVSKTTPQTTNIPVN